MTRHFGIPNVTRRETAGASQSPASHYRARGLRELNLSPPELRFPNSSLQLVWDLLAISFGALLLSAFVAGIGSGFAVLLYYLFSLGE